MKTFRSRMRARNVEDATGALADFAPYVDFLFSLITIFLIAASTMLGGVNVELPKGDSEVLVVKKEPLIVSIKRDGSIYLEKDQIKLNTLASKLSEFTMGDNQIKIFVKADKNIVYDRVIAVVGAIYTAGFFDVTLVTDLQKM